MIVIRRRSELERVRMNNPVKGRVKTRRRSGLRIGERLRDHFRVFRKLVQRLNSQLQSDSGKRRRRRMETESPQGLNLHPAKQPRTTLFDWLPEGLPSVPTWTNLHGSLHVSLFPLSVCVLFFFASSSYSLLSLCFFGTIPLIFSSHSRSFHSLLDRFLFISAMAAQKCTFTDYVKAALFLKRSFLHSDLEDREENRLISINLF